MTRIYRKQTIGIRPNCVECGRPAHSAGKRKDGTTRYAAICSHCRRKKYGRYERKNRWKLLADCCERCGFVPENIRQLDVHHIDGNHKNNDPENLRTLCANCHRLIHSY